MSRFFASVLVILFIIGALIASDARQAVVGAGYISDENDIITNPAYALDYDNFARMELGDFGASNSWGTANIHIHNNLVLGAHFNREDGAIYSMLDSYSSIPDPINGFGLYGATSFGDLQFGLGIYNVSKKSVTKIEPEGGTDTETTIKSSAFSVIAGIETGPIAGSFGVGFNSFEDVDDPGDEFSSEGGMEIYAEFWGEFPMSDKVNLVPVAGFNTYKYNTKSVVSDTETSGGDISYMAFTVGAAAQMPIRETGVFSAAAAFDMSQEKDESTTDVTYTENWMSIPRINIAADVPLFETELKKTGVPVKCNARAGMQKLFSKSVSKSENDYGTTTTSNMYSENNADFIAVGAGFDIGDFTIDMTISENIFYTGTYIISGNSENLSSNISIAYNFGK